MYVLYICISRDNGIILITRRGGNDERDRRVQVVKTALAVISFVQCSSNGRRMALTFKRCMSAEKPWIVAGCVLVGE